LNTVSLTQEVHFYINRAWLYCNSCIQHLPLLGVKFLFVILFWLLVQLFAFIHPAGENISELWFFLMHEVEICSSMRTVLDLVAATSRHCFVIPFIHHFFEGEVTNYVIKLLRWDLSLITMPKLIVSVVCACIVHHKVMCIRISLTGINSDSSALEERVPRPKKVLSSQTSSALGDAQTLSWVIWTLLSPLRCYNGFKRFKGE
jgi:hypothetical protein